MKSINSTKVVDTQGAVHKRRRQLGGGKGSKIGQNCRQIVLKNCRHEGGGYQTSGKIADVVYGWSLRPEKISHFMQWLTSAILAIL